MSTINFFRDVRRWLAEGDFPSVKTTTVYADHVGENTGAHTIVMDHDVSMTATKSIFAGSTNCHLGTDTAPFGNLNGLQVFGRAAASGNTTYIYMKHDGTDGSIESVIGKMNLTAASSINLLSDTIIANTKHIKCATAAGSDIGLTGTRFGNIFGTALYAVTHYADHIAENTGAHGVVFDNDITRVGKISVDHIGEATGAHTVTIDNTVTMADATNIILNATTGTKIGTGTDQKLAFHNSTPVIQRAGATQAALAAYVTGAFGLDSDAHMQAMFDLVVEIRAVLVEKGLMKGAA